MSSYRQSFLDEPAVRMEDVSLSYARTGEILSAIDLVLKQGSFTFLTGPSGAGKSSLLKLIYLALRQNSGMIRLFGQQTSRLNRAQLSAMRRRIGVVFQEFRLLEHLNAFENVALPLRIQGRRRETYRTEVEDLLRWVGLGERVDAAIQSLSGGEQQRVAIARAIAPKPRILLADEPTGNLDSATGEKVVNTLFKSAQDAGAALVLVTHDAALAARCSRVLQIEDGVIAGDTKK